MITEEYEKEWYARRVSMSTHGGELMFSCGVFGENIQDSHHLSDLHQMTDSKTGKFIRDLTVSRVTLSNCWLKSLHNIHHYVSMMAVGQISLYSNPIQSHVLGLLLIDGLANVKFLHQDKDNVSKYMQSKYTKYTQHPDSKWMRLSSRLHNEVLTLNIHDLERVEICINDALIQISIDPTSRHSVLLETQARLIDQGLEAYAQI